MNLEKFHVFDRQTEENLKKRVPEYCYIPCSVQDHRIVTDGFKLSLPPALLQNDAMIAEAVVPVTAVKLGHGDGRATVKRKEEAENGTLYVLSSGELTLFALGDSGECDVGSTVFFDIDMRYIKIEACEIEPMKLENRLEGTFIKEKSTNGKYSFFINISGQKLIPSPELCKKLFACNGTKIFSASLEYIFDADSVQTADGNSDAIEGTVCEIFDYGKHCYARADIGGQKVNVPYRGQVGDRIYIRPDPDSIAVKDKKLDIIIA